MSSLYLPFSGALPYTSAPLFDEKTLNQFLRECDTTPLTSATQPVIEWLNGLGKGGSESTESNLEQTFNQKILIGALGYVLWPSQPASAVPKASARMTGVSKIPDVVLGSFSADRQTQVIKAVVELKEPGTDLDRPQSRENQLSPVEQAFTAGEAILGVRWVIVSDMVRLRLYSIESRSDYEAFDLRQCVGAEGRPTREFKKLFFLLHHDYLIKGEEDSPTSKLLGKSAAQKFQIEQSFYGTYYEIRSDLILAVDSAAKQKGIELTRDDLLESVQRLLDRLLFLYYCEAHPQQLIPTNTVKMVCESARKIPGTSTCKVYSALKDLFREVDIGSPQANEIRLSAYNGELFKPHPVVDVIDLPDTLYDKVYYPRGGVDARVVRGAWGLYVFDFWRELGVHLLGHIFEESLSDIVALRENREVTLAEKLAERKQHGIYFTRDLLSDYLTHSSLKNYLGEHAKLSEEVGDVSSWNKRIEVIANLRIVDFACGSGVFLVSSYRELLREFWALRERIQLVDDKSNELPLEIGINSAYIDQATLLRHSLYGIDLLPQAVEIAKLALWLASARKGEKVADLGSNIVTENSLHIKDILIRMGLDRNPFDLVVGNPPWGAEIAEEDYVRICQFLKLEREPRWDSWELFLLLGLDVLRDGGRLALVLPDTLLYGEKMRLREMLLKRGRIEKLLSLGPDWFGPNVRMGTVLLQVRKGEPGLFSDYVAMVLSGEMRQKAIRGEVPLTQLVSEFGRRVPQSRSDSSPNKSFELFRSVEDDVIISKIETNSTCLGDLTESGARRGEEMSKSGLLWQCPGCMCYTLPGQKKKGRSYANKSCPRCGLVLKSGAVNTANLVVTNCAESNGYVEFLDGDDFSERYRRVGPTKWMRLDVPDWEYKPKELYAPPKILVREAGVGIAATLDTTNARVPRSVYIYRLLPEAITVGYAPEFLLGVLLSRTAAYYLLKRSGQVDPARAFANVRIENVNDLPVPRINASDKQQANLRDTIVANVKRLLGGAKLGGPADLEIEQALRKLWTLTPEEGAHINGEFAMIPSGQAVRALFPDGVPGTRKAALNLVPA